MFVPHCRSSSSQSWLCSCHHDLYKNQSWKAHVHHLYTPSSNFFFPVICQILITFLKQQQKQNTPKPKRRNKTITSSLAIIQSFFPLNLDCHSTFLTGPFISKFFLSSLFSPWQRAPVVFFTINSGAVYSVENISGDEQLLP